MFNNLLSDLLETLTSNVIDSIINLSSKKRKISTKQLSHSWMIWKQKIQNIIGKKEDSHSDNPEKSIPGIIISKI